MVFNNSSMNSNYTNISNNSQSSDNYHLKHNFQNAFLQYCKNQTGRINNESTVESDCNNIFTNNVSDQLNTSYKENTQNEIEIQNLIDKNDNILTKLDVMPIRDIEPVRALCNFNDNALKTIGSDNKTNDIEDSTNYNFNNTDTINNVKVNNTTDNSYLQDIEILMDKPSNVAIGEIVIQKHKINIETLNVDFISISSNDELEIPEILKDDLDSNAITLNSDSSFINNDVDNIFNTPNSNGFDEFGNVATVVNNTGTVNLNKDVVNKKYDDTNESDSCSYHSSDFEFISEEEAKLDGFIINFRAQTVDIKESKDKNVDKKISNNINRINLNDIEDIFNYRDNHSIPEGDDYLELFQGIYTPAYNSYFIENKSVRTNSMNVEFEGIGFDIKLLNKKYVEDNFDVEYRGEAEETARKILKLYPGDNRKRRRHH